MTARAKKAVVLAVLVTPLFIGGAQAATYDWKNSGTDFNAPASWYTKLPTSQIAVFPSTAAMQPNLSSSFTALGLQFPTGASGYNITATSPFALTLTPLTTPGTSIAINGLNTKGVNTIQAPLVLGAAAGATQTFSQAAGGSLVVNGAISSTNGVTLNISGATTSGVTNGVVTLGGASSYTGGTTLNTLLTLNINNGGNGGTSSAIGTGGFNWNSGGIIDNTSGSGVTLSTNNNVALIGTTSYTFTGSNDLDFGSGTITAIASPMFSNNSTTGKTLTFGSLVNDKFRDPLILTVDGAINAPVVFGGFILNKGSASALNNTIKGSGSVKFTGVISNGSAVATSLTYRGTGLLQMGGANTYTGTTTVESGTVQLDGTTMGQGYFLVQPGSFTTVAPKLTGTGTIGLAPIQGLLIRGGNGFSTFYSATVNPGDIDTISATLRVGTDRTNKVTFGDSSVLAIDINGDATDKLAITGDLDLSSTSDKLLINTTGDQTLGRYVFATYTGSLASQFETVSYKGASLPANLSIDYSNHEIALVGLPEPVGMSVLLGSAFAGLLRRRRTRQA